MKLVSLMLAKKYKKIKKIKTSKKRLVVIASVLILGSLYIFSLTANAASGYVWFYEEQKFTQKLNSYRSSKGVGAVRRSKCLTDAARSWSKTIATRNSLQHSDYDLISTFCGITGSSGEIVQYTTSFGTADEVLKIWKNSPAHNSIMLDGAYDYMGVGIFFDTAHEKTWATGLLLDCNSGCPSGVTGTPSDYFGPDSNKCAYIRPNKSKIYTGDKFSADIAFLNTGGAIWFPSNHGAYWAGSGPNVWGSSKAALGANASGIYFNAGLQGWHSGAFTAPKQAGTYEFKWRMKNSSGFFGSTCSKSITVYGNSTSSQPTGTTSTSTGTDSNKESDGDGGDDSQKQPTNVTVVRKLALNGNIIDKEIPEFAQDVPIKFSGYSKPNSKLKLYIFSETHKTIVTTDKKGYWEYEAQPLEPGNHHVEIALLDAKTGKEVKHETVVKFKVLEAISQPENYSGTGIVSNPLKTPAKFPKTLIVIVGPVLIVTIVITNKFWWPRFKRMVKNKVSFL